VFYEHLNKFELLTDLIALTQIAFVWDQVKSLTYQKIVGIVLLQLGAAKHSVSFKQTYKSFASIFENLKPIPLAGKCNRIYRWQITKFKIMTTIEILNFQI